MLSPRIRHIISKGANESSPRVILLFLGWGMDATPFACLSKSGYDVIALADYVDANNAELRFDADYKEVIVVAWSFGVRAAVDFINSTRLPVTRTIAVNGTTMHIDDVAGIPHSIFAGTLSGLSDVTVRKFRRRMFGSSAEYKEFESKLSNRSLDSLTTELEVFARTAPSPDSGLWSLAVIGGRDLIFPADNQRNAWENIHIVELPEMSHFADLQYIIDRYIVDKSLVAKRFAGASASYDDHAAVQQSAAAELWRLTSAEIDLNRTYARVLEIGAGSGLLTRIYLPELKMKSLLLWDLGSTPSFKLPEFVVTNLCDAESSIDTLVDESVDMIISSSTIQWFHSPARFIGKAAGKLSQGGYMALMYYADGTFRELVAAGGRTLAYPDNERLLRALSAHGMRLLHHSTSEEQLIFDTPHQALRHIKSTGVNSLDTGFAAGNTARRLLRDYPLDVAGRATLTFVKSYIIAIKE